MSWTSTLFNFLAKARYYTTPQDNVDGSVVELQANRRGHLMVDIYGGNSTWQDTVSPASERVVKSTKGTLFQLAFVNTGATDVWIFVFDHPSAGGARPTGGGVPLFVPFKVPAGGEKAVSLQRPRSFVSGIYWGASTSNETFLHNGDAEIMAAAEYS